MKRRLTFIGVWGLSCLILSIGLLLLMVFTNGRGYWFLPLLALGLPSAGLVLASLGLLPGTGRKEKILVRAFTPRGWALQLVEAVRIKSRVYRIISPNSGEQWEFSTGDIVQCAEQEMPDGHKKPIAILRV